VNLWNAKSNATPCKVLPGVIHPSAPFLPPLIHDQLKYLTLTVRAATQGDHSYSTMIFHDFSITKKMNFHDLSAQHIFFRNKRYTTYEWLPEQNIFPVARCNYCHKIKPQVYVHVSTSISVLQISLSNTTSLTALEILQHSIDTKLPWEISQ